MSIRWSAAVVVGALLLARANTAPPPAARIPVPPSPIVDRSHPTSGPYEVAPEQMAAVVNAQLRVMPDRRFLLAAHDVELLLTGRSDAVVVDFADGRWTIRVGSTDAWSLPDLPTFGDGLEALTAFAKSVRGNARPVGLPPAVLARADADLHTGDMRGIFAAVKAIETASHGKLVDADGMSRLAHAAMLLNARTQDRFGIADDERARALALIAIARSFDPNAVAGDVAAMADICGYSTEAQALTGALPSGSIPDRSDLPVGGDALNYGIAAEHLDDFEHLVTASVATAHSRWISRDIVATHLRSEFYSYEYERFHELEHDLASKRASEHFIASLGSATIGFAPEIVDWMNATVALQYHGGTGVAPDRVLAGMSDIGAERRAELLNSSEKVLGDSTASVRRGAFAFFARCDSRPSMLYPLGVIAMYILHDPSRRDLYLSAALARAPSTLDKSVAGWIPFAIGDLEAVRRVAASPDASSDDRASALLELSKVEGADQQQIGAAFEALFSSTSHGYPIFAEWANTHHEWQRKERLARRWLAASPEGIEGAYFASSLADALLHEHRNEEALQLAKRYTEINSYNALQETMAALAGTGDSAGADDLGRQLMQRYPGVPSHVDYAIELWQQKRYSDAAALLDPKENELAPNELANALAPAFNETFDGDHATDAIEAFAAVVPILSENTLTQIVSRLRFAGRNDLAFRFADRLLAIPGHRGTDERLNGFEALRALKGTPEATAWVQQRVTQNDRVALVLDAHQHADELVLAYWTPPATPPKAHEMELIAAASAVHLRLATDDPRRAALADSLQHEPIANDFHQPIARYLLGLADEHDLFAQGKTNDDRSSVAYFRGLKAAADGDYDGALPWLLAAEESPELTWGMNWATSQLSHWNSPAGLSWEEVKRRQLQ